MPCDATLCGGADSAETGRERTECRQSGSVGDREARMLEGNLPLPPASLERLQRGPGGGSMQMRRASSLTAARNAAARICTPVPTAEEAPAAQGHDERRRCSWTQTRTRAGPKGHGLTGLAGESRPRTSVARCPISPADTCPAECLERLPRV
jgi:hypothetical protein